jgi:hypothetical protein
MMFLWLFADFHECEVFKKSLHNTFIALIPKKMGAEDIKDYRPISLVVVSTNFSLRCLLRDQRRMLGNILLDLQNTFMEGRQILDSVLCQGMLG